MKRVSSSFRTHSPALMMMELALMGKPKILASSDVSLKRLLLAEGVGELHVPLVQGELLPFEVGLLVQHPSRCSCSAVAVVSRSQRTLSNTSDERNHKNQQRSDPPVVGSAGWQMAACEHKHCVGSTSDQHRNNVTVTSSGDI
ncbi:hypothetical protein EYF80_037444 [Liparis tanakae]|uniref:Uncharacterized protein n=1 Tax=Liparis tanakae TaxID=230148 RepID=A0A4Z2GGK9_9TELE|nr:hypothetical protein EYF80_037444 [Liparis tanakae]